MVFRSAASIAAALLIYSAALSGGGNSFPLWVAAAAEEEGLYPDPQAGEGLLGADMPPEREGSELAVVGAPAGPAEERGEAPPPIVGGGDNAEEGEKKKATQRDAPRGGASPAGIDKNAPPPNPRQPYHPIIAIVANPMVECTAGGKRTPPEGYAATGCVTDLYLRWLQGQGIRMVPMNIFWPEERKKALLDKVNGVLLPGGGLDGADREEYTHAAEYIMDYAMARPGFLLWGTCQGMQVMGILAFEKDFSVLECDYTGMLPSMLPLEFTQYQPHSVMFSAAAERSGAVHAAEAVNSTMNWHECGIQPRHFMPEAAAAEGEVERGHSRNARMKVISTNVDTSGKPFVSAFEIVDGGRNIFAVQFHPERPQYQFTHDKITHERETIDLAIYFSRFIYDRLQLNNHSFDSQEEANAMLLENYPHQVTGWGLGHYWINI